MFGATYLGDGNPQGNISLLKSQNPSIVEGLFMDYNYNGLIVDEYEDRITNNQGDLIFKSQDNVGRMVAHNAANYRTVYGSFVFGGIIDGYDINTRKVLMNRLLSFLLYIEPKIDVTMTPVTPQVPRRGVLDIDLRLENTSTTQTVDFRIYTLVYVPSGAPFGGNPVDGPVNLSFVPGRVLNHAFSHTIPPPAPLGTYTYVAVVTDQYFDKMYDIDAFEFTVVPD
jgi:hypothetical protein